MAPTLLASRMVPIMPSTTIKNHREIRGTPLEGLNNFEVNPFMRIA
jgi:hypothetical protein